uniref:CSON013277 protein n=1 Tax=Culicoides sonorensis TaxID=179676 RepID=A0A336M7I9_CULSO
MGDTPMPNIDMHRLIIRRKMTALKESLKNTEKLLDDALLTLGSVPMRVDEEGDDDDSKNSSKTKVNDENPDVKDPNRKWSVTSIYF